ncbi:MAG: APC family permease [Terriglobales bacterium]
MQSDSTASAPPGPASAELRPQPPRVMGFSDLVLFYVVTGVSLRWIATAAASGPSSIVIWIGALLCFYTPLALAVIELSSRHPQEGGLYVWSQRAFGDFSGYMAGWAYWTSNLPYFPSVLYFAASNALYIRQGNWSRLSNNANFHIWFSILALLLITAMNVVGLNIGKWLHNAGALGMWLPAMIVMVMGFYAWHRFGAATSFTRASLIPGSHLKDMVFWATLAFAFAGCETGSLIAGEIKNSRRTLPRALLVAGVIVAFCYIMGTVCVLLAVPSAEVNDLQGLMQAISRTAGKLGWFAIIPISAALIAISNLGAAGAYLASVARLPFVAGIDRFLPPAFGKLHPRWHTPHIALIAQLICAVLFVFLAQAGTSVKGAYGVLVSMSIITYFIPYLYVFAALFKLQRQKAGAEVIRVPGGAPVAKVVSCVGFATTMFTILLSVVPSPEETNKVLAVIKVVGLSGALVGAGALLYYLGKRRKQHLAMATIA